MPGPYDVGWARICWAGHFITNWIGDMGFTRKLGGRVTKPNVVGAMTKMQGTVVAKRKEGGEALVDIEWWGRNPRGITHCNGTATVRLPTRDNNVGALKIRRRRRNPKNPR